MLGFAQSGSGQTFPIFSTLPRLMSILGSSSPVINSASCFLRLLQIKGNIQVVSMWPPVMPAQAVLVGQRGCLEQEERPVSCRDERRFLEEAASRLSL